VTVPCTGRGRLASCAYHAGRLFGIGSVGVGMGGWSGGVGAAAVFFRQRADTALKVTAPSSAFG